MKIFLFILFYNISQQTFCQKKWFDIDRSDLDTMIFDRHIFDRLEINKDKFGLKNKMIWTLENVAIYNSYIGKLINEMVISPKFTYKNDTIISVDFFIGARKINLLSEFQILKNGFVILKNGANEGHYYTVKLIEYKNSKSNGITCIYYGRHDTFYLTRQNYFDGKPVGKYHSYNFNGTLKEEGDSLQAYNFRKIKTRRYNEFGEFVKYEFEEIYDTRKIGNWKYYNSDGILVKQEYFE